MRFLALVAAWLALAMPAAAATTAQKASAANLYACGVTNAGILPYLCADFRNGVYVLNGTRYSSIQAMGATVPVGCTISSGTGLSCTTSNITIPAKNPSGGWMMVTNSKYTTAVVSDGAALDDGTHAVGSLSFTASTRVIYTTSQNCVTSNTGLMQDAVYETGTGIVCSVAGGAVGTQTVTAPNANSTLRMGAFGSSNPVALPFYVGSVRLYLGTFTNAQVQKASTQ